MKTFLLAIAGCVVGVLLLIALGWLWLRRKLRGLGKVLGQLAAGLSGVPPFRITLVPVPDGDEPFENAGDVEAATRSLEGVGYRRLEDFEVQEMEEVLVRAFWHPEQLSYAAVTEHPQAGVFTDVVGLFTDRSLLTVSNAPETGLDHPERAGKVNLPVSDPGEVHRLHERLVAETEASGRRPVGTTPEQFVIAFEGSYRMEQDWRIARGGPSADEIRRAAAAGGQEPPDDCAVELVQSTWRAAITEFVSEEALKAWLAAEPMPAAEWEVQRDRIRVVHDHCDAGEFVEELAGEIVADATPSADLEDDDAWDRAHEQAKERLAPTFADGARAGFSEAQALLPEKRRFRKLGSVEGPWPADVYLQPDEAEAAV